MHTTQLGLVLRFSALLMVALTSACEEDVSSRAEHAPSEATAAQELEQAHAAPGATPGSHEDWCGGHGVPESLCTRCNPALIGAFQATGDWCPEHGLPESQCLICNPDLVIERPPRSAEASP